MCQKTTEGPYYTLQFCFRNLVLGKFHPIISYMDRFTQVKFCFNAWNGFVFSRVHFQVFETWMAVALDYTALITHCNSIFNFMKLKLLWGSSVDSFNFQKPHCFVDVYLSVIILIPKLIKLMMLGTYERNWTICFCHGKVHQTVFGSKCLSLQKK